MRIRIITFSVDAPRIAILGFGFSGLLTLANLVRHLRGGTIYVVGEDLRGLGLAYGTANTAHVLNVPAGRMGAFPDAVDGFLQWIGTHDGALAKQQLGLTKEYTAADFAPRALYAAYLSDVWAEAQTIAARHGCSIKLVETTATRMRVEDGLAVLTARGDAIAVDTIILATGNELKPILPQVKSVQVIQNPWAPGALEGAALWASPVLLMGAGLTAVDTVLSLRSAGYAGEIIAFSRHGMWPATHVPQVNAMVLEKDAFAAQKTLSGLLQQLRSIMRVNGEWRAVIDALRPQTQTLWQRLTRGEQQRFFRRLLSVWNVHRHRMAPEIAAQLGEDSRLRLEAAKQVEARVEEGVLEVTLHTNHASHAVWRPSRVVNCTGGQMVVAQSANPLLRQALADGVLEPHANGVGVALDPQLRAWGAAYPQLFVIGALATGQLLESTAVPELRGQAAQIAAAICA